MLEAAWQVGIYTLGMCGVSLRQSTYRAIKKLDYDRASATPIALRGQLIRA